MKTPGCRGGPEFNVGNIYENQQLRIDSGMASKYIEMSRYEQYCWRVASVR